MDEFGAYEELKETVSLKAIMCVTAPHTLPYVQAITRAVHTLPDSDPQLLWVNAQTRGNRAATIDALYTSLRLDRPHRPRPRRLADAEHLIASELKRTEHLMIVLGAHQLRTESLEMLYTLWDRLVPGHFPLVLTGESGKLERALDRPALASLKSSVYLRCRAPEPS